MNELIHLTLSTPVIKTLTTAAALSLAMVAIYKVGYHEADQNWRRVLAEKNLIVLEVKTNCVTNLNGSFTWVK